MKAYVQEIVYVIASVFMVIMCQLIPVCALAWGRDLEQFHRLSEGEREPIFLCVYSCVIHVNSLITVCFNLPVCK